MFIWLNTLQLHSSIIFTSTCRHHCHGVAPSVRLRQKMLSRSRVAALHSQVHGRRSARAAKNCRQSVWVFTPSWIICILLQSQSLLRRVLPSDRGHISLTHIPPRPQLPSPHFSLQNPFSMRARCSKDPESLAAERWDSHHSLNENMRGERRGRKKLQEERTSLIPHPPSRADPVIVVLPRKTPVFEIRTCREAELMWENDVAPQLLSGILMWSVKPHERTWKF